MMNEYFVDQVQAANNSTADWWKLRQSTRIIINTFRGQWNTPGSYKSLKSYISRETPVLDSNPAARGWKYLFRLQQQKVASSINKNNRVRPWSGVNQCSFIEAVGTKSIYSSKNLAYSQQGFYRTLKTSPFGEFSSALCLCTKLYPHKSPRQYNEVILDASVHYMLR